MNKKKLSIAVSCNKLEEAKRKEVPADSTAGVINVNSNKGGKIKGNETREKQILFLLVQIWENRLKKTEAMSKKINLSTTKRLS